MSIVKKSYEVQDPIVNYCTSHSIVQNAMQVELMEVTLREAAISQMLGAPEVLTFGQNFIHLINGKKCLDIGTYTGASALAWALATGKDGQVYTLDIDHSNFKRFGIPIISKCQETFNKIIPREGQAVQTLEELLANGHEGTFDFAFIDADKLNYVNYYNLCVSLLRSGGVILVDNALWNGHVTQADVIAHDPSTRAIDVCNKLIFKDDRCYTTLINSGDGLHIAFKK